MLQISIKSPLTTKTATPYNDKLRDTRATMNASDQNKPEYDTTYNPHTALEFFKLVGNIESVKAGHHFFVQGQKSGILSFLQSEKLYLLFDGAVTIQTLGGLIVDLEAGELFGEFTPYSLLNASATAKSACKLMSITEKQLLEGLKKKPEFLFMLMDVLAPHLQKAHTEPAPSKQAKEYLSLNSKMLAELKQKLGESALTTVPEKRVVFQKGAAASLMYVILEGSMTVTIDDKVIGHCCSGNIVGEIALATHQHARTANVIAETRCVLLAITRQSLFDLIPSLPAFGISLLRALGSHLRVT
jgi:CRP-like cAMP-binding protein